MITSESLSESFVSVAKSSLFFAIGTLLSRIVGLLRESTKAAIFGAGLLNDSFIIAYRIPNLLREMLAEGALGASFTKVFTALWEEDKERAKRVLIDSIWLAGLAVGLISLLGMIFAPWLVKLLALYAANNEHGTELVRQATGLTRILFPFITVMSVASIVAGALHQKGKFFLSSVSSIALNIGFITGALYFSFMFEKHGPDWIETALADKKVVGLAVGVLLGGFLQLLVLGSGIWKDLLKGNLAFPRKLPWSSDVKKILVLMGPMTIAASAAQINIMVNTNFATSLQPGAVTWLASAFILAHLPVAIFGVAIGSVSLPTLSRAVAKAGKKIDKTVSTSLQNSLELVSWLLIPSAVFVYFNNRDFVRIVFEHGRFDAVAADATAETLKVYAFGLLSFSLIKVLSSFYYAIDRTSYAMKVSLFSIFINFTANYFLVDQFGHVGLAATASTVVSINALLLMFGILKDKPQFSGKNFAATFVLILLAGTAALLVQFFGQDSLNLMIPSELNMFSQALVRLVVNGLLIVFIFAAAGCFRLKKSPIQLAKSLRKS